MADDNGLNYWTDEQRATQAALISALQEVAQHVEGYVIVVKRKDGQVTLAASQADAELIAKAPGAVLAWADKNRGPKAVE